MTDTCRIAYEVVNFNIYEYLFCIILCCILVAKYHFIVFLLIWMLSETKYQVLERSFELNIKMEWYKIINWLKSIWLYVFRNSNDFMNYRSIEAM